MNYSTFYWNITFRNTVFLHKTFIIFEFRAANVFAYVNGSCYASVSVVKLHIYMGFMRLECIFTDNKT